MWLRFVQRSGRKRQCVRFDPPASAGSDEWTAFELPVTREKNLSVHSSGYRKRFVSWPKQASEWNTEPRRDLPELTERWISYSGFDVDEIGDRQASVARQNRQRLPDLNSSLVNSSTRGEADWATIGGNRPSRDGITAGCR
jgi:hypothetical protein